MRNNTLNICEYKGTFKGTEIDLKFTEWARGRFQGLIATKKR